MKNWVDRKLYKFIRINPIFRGYPRNSGRFALVRGGTMFEGPNYYMWLIFSRGKFVLLGNMLIKKKDKKKI